ncbi:MAG: alpha/beta hydrolase [Shewanella sp.]|nr:alpha/beta hydrolase [Shewanella sp.]
MAEYFIEQGIDKLVSEFIEGGCPSMAKLSLTDRRQGYVASSILAGEKRELPEVQNITKEDVCLRIYKASNENNLPVVVYFHGGCFVSGSFDTHEQQLREIAFQANAIVVAVKYRLAPEYCYPAAHDDAFCAANYIYQNCHLWGGSNKKIILVGDSAGGQLALVTSFRLRDTGNWQPKKQILIYPMLDATASCDSYKVNGQDFIITSDALISGFDMYVEGSSISHTHPEISPFFRDDLKGLPETHIITAEFDPLLDEGELFYKKLLAAQVPAQCRRYLGVIHGFFQLSSLSQSARESIAHISQIVKSV